ncbi:unnamed protein product [Timema podura]|uniref:Uncharacterized protein n=1 Tax=Timema podura TaxID=61482 RepID=A0ABN7PFY3_TIMPD|nr:unnamed protein product [Timema podura]
MHGYQPARLQQG